MNIKNYFNVSNILKFIGLLLMLLGLSDVLTPEKAEDVLYIGVAFLALSYIFISSSSKIETLPQSMGEDSVVKGNEIWEPIANKDSSFHTQRLVKYFNRTIKVRPTIKQTLFNLRIIFFGLFALLMAFVVFVLLENYISILPAMIGVMFLWFGIHNIKQKETLLFNLDTAQFSEKDEESKRIIPFSQIHGLQLIEVYNKVSRTNMGNSDRYYSYELNLILKNAQRINILSHGDKNEIIKDTKMLATYLSVPIWYEL